MCESLTNMSHATQALTQDRLFDALPCVMVTAKGMPDLATRAFCCKLLAAFPGLKVGAGIRSGQDVVGGICLIAGHTGSAKMQAVRLLPNGLQREKELACPT